MRTIMCRPLYHGLFIPWTIRTLAVCLNTADYRRLGQIYRRLVMDDSRIQNRKSQFFARNRKIEI